MKTNQELVQLADEYRNWYNWRNADKLQAIPYHYVDNDVEMATKIANIYEKTEDTGDYSLLVEVAYQALLQQVHYQFMFAVEHGYTFEAWNEDGQPYANSTEMCEDVEKNHHLYYFTGGDVHPLLQEYNNEFRAIHDLFGHAMHGYQFGAKGEHNAWIEHSSMFSPLAQRALTTETRGQNSWVNYGPYRDLPANERPFAEQKCFLLPIEYCDYKRYL